MASLSSVGATRQVQFELIAKFTQEFPYSNEEEKLEIINQISEAAASLFSRFLDPNTDFSKSKIKTVTHSHYPTEDKIEKFKNALFEKLQCSDPKKYYRVVVTRDQPQGILRESLMQANIVNFDDIFPKQSYLDIVLSDNKIVVDIDFQKSEN